MQERGSLFCVLAIVCSQAAFPQATSDGALRHCSSIAAEAMQRQDYAAAEGAYQALLAFSKSRRSAQQPRSCTYLQKKYEPAIEQFQLALKLRSSLFPGSCPRRQH